MLKPANKIKIGDITELGEILAVEFQRGLFNNDEMNFLVVGTGKKRWVAVPEEKEIKITKLSPLYFQN